MGLLSFFSETPPPLIRSSMDALDEMLATTHRMFEAATACLLTSAPVALDLKAEDERVNTLEAEIRRALLTHFSVSPGDDLALGLTLNAVVQDVDLDRSVMSANDGVKADAAAYIIRLTERPDLGANEGIVLALTARLISRYGSHLSNVASGFVLPFDELRHSL